MTKTQPTNGNSWFSSALLLVLLYLKLSHQNDMSWWVVIGIPLLINLPRAILTILEEKHK